MKSIAQKLVKVMEACSYVYKDGTNDFHRYKYASAANVLEKVNAACVKNGIATVSNSKIYEIREITNAKGNTERLVTVETTITLIDMDSGESLTITSLGQGQDPTDKAVAKAQTMALKYAWMTALNISTGDDPEADVSVDERSGAEPQKSALQPSKTNGSITDQQRKKIYAEIKSKKINEEKFKDFLKTKFQVESIEQLTKQQASMLIDYFNKQNVA